MQDLYQYRYTLWNLVLKEFRTQYRNMSLGIMWSVINPMIMLGVLVIVFTYIRGTNRGENFAIFLLIGLIHYNFFSQCMAGSTTSLVNNAQIIKKLQFPRLIIPFSSVLSNMIHLFIQVCILFIFIMIFGVPFTFSFLWLLLSFFVQTLFILGLSMITSSLDVYFRDTQYIVQSSITVLFWFTPIFYPASQANENLPKFMYYVFMANPLSGCIEASRRAILYQSAPEWDLFMGATLVALSFLLIGSVVFRRLENNLADKL